MFIDVVCCSKYGKSNYGVHTVDILDEFCRFYYTLLYFPNQCTIYVNNHLFPVLRFTQGALQTGVGPTKNTTSDTVDCIQSQTT